VKAASLNNLTRKVVCYQTTSGKNVSTANKTRYRSNGYNAIIEELLEAVFSIRSVPRLYKQTRPVWEIPRAWGYNQDTLFLGDINTGTWSQI
jgi:hypothetical protein